MQDLFIKRHLGSCDQNIKQMLEELKLDSVKTLIKQTLPSEIDSQDDLSLPEAISEQDVLQKAKAYAQKNQVFKNYIGQGYVPCITPGCIQRNILENPAWYTSYTPYQSELAQGRLEALLNFQTLVTSLTGMEVAGCSLLDEGTAAAEACSLAKNVNDKKPNAKKFFVDSHTFPQTIDVLKTRSQHLGWEMVVGDFKTFQSDEDFFACFLQYPNAQGEVTDIKAFLERMKQSNTISIVASDLLSLCLIESPGKMQASICVGSSGRFGVPLFYGGPHAGFLAVKKEYSRSLPGRIVGVSKDRHQQPALRLALQTREQHIRRERATSNICTSQVLLAVVSSFYACYHGPQGLKKQAERIYQLTYKLKKILKSFEGQLLTKNFFDTISWQTSQSEKVYQAFLKHKINIYKKGDVLSWTLSELTTENDIKEIETILNSTLKSLKPVEEEIAIPPIKNQRTDSFLTHPVFNSYHSETEMLRYIHLLQNKELSLTHSMIPLGSCTMKLNGVTEMAPCTWPEFSQIHPLAPENQTQGWQNIISDLNKQLCEITGFSKFSFQPNAGSQGEYAGLLTIKKFHASQNQAHRDICLIPTSAHGTNPASAKMAGLKVVPVLCTKEGSIDIKDLDEKLQKYRDSLCCMMLTYPSTYGIFEEGVKDICKKIHDAGALVYLDGANMNALLGLCKVRSIGFDVAHLNLHKTFCIPHGGGGPGAGPIGVSSKLAQFLPGHVWQDSSGACSSAPYGNAGVLIIPWAYILLMGKEGLKASSELAILNANYIASRLEKHYRILFKGRENRVAHECIIDLRKFKNTADIHIDDIAKRLIDYSFHAPTMSWPVPGTLMIEPTESESKAELDKFCEALICIKKELLDAEKQPKLKALLKNAPHTLEDVFKNEWELPYTKEQAFYPQPWVKKRKFWPPVSRVDNAYGDINLFCSCVPMSEMSET